MLPRWALAAWSHSCCRCGASLLMLGPACSSELPANTADVVLLCVWQGAILVVYCTRWACLP